MKRFKIYKVQKSEGKTHHQELNYIYLGAKNVGVCTNDWILFFVIHSMLVEFRQKVIPPFLALENLLLHIFFRFLKRLAGQTQRPLPLEHRVFLEGEDEI